jgi:shikimate dehydrogenase
VLGFNVTVPYKELIMAELDEITQEAADIGAVNTVINQKGILVGHNTDGAGFIRGLREEGKFEPEGKTTLVIGAGGSSKAVSHHLLQNKISHLIIANRTTRRAKNLRTALTSLGHENIHLISLTEIDLKTILTSNIPPDLIVNCTSLGMVGGPDPTQAAIQTHLIPSSSLVCDLVYNPLITPLLQGSIDSGAQILTGLPMLIYQGALAFHLWSNHEPPIEIMFDAAKKALE